MRILLIDDSRNMDVTKIARDYYEGVLALSCRRWDLVYLDHDLGGDKTGYDIMCWLEEHQDCLPPKIVCISANPPGRDRINAVIKKLYGEIAQDYYAHPTSFIDDNVSIGSGTKIWHNTHISSGTSIGANCNIGQCVFIGRNVIIGNGCKLQNGVNVFTGCKLEDNVFLGPNVTTTNDFYPSVSNVIFDGDYNEIIIKAGASIGAGSILIGKKDEPLIIGEGSLVGAGTIVTKNVEPNTLIYQKRTTTIKNYERM